MPFYFRFVWANWLAITLLTALFLRCHASLHSTRRCFSISMLDFTFLTISRHGGYE
jgi:hypothetical protein